MIPQICRSISVILPKTSHPLLLHKPQRFPFSLSVFFFSTCDSKTTVFDYLVNHHQFDPESHSNSLFLNTHFVRNPEKCDSVLNFLKDANFSKTQIENVVMKMPQVLFGDVERAIKPKVSLFWSLGFDSNDVAEIICSEPWILKRSADNWLAPSISVLMNVLGSTEDVAKLLKKFGWVLRHDLEKTMVPNIEFMRSCGISSSWIVEYVCRFPRIFLVRPEFVEDVVRRIDELGVDRKSKTYIRAMQVMSSRSKHKWELKLEFFRQMGFTEEDILRLFRRTPRVFALSEMKIEIAVKFLLGEGNLGISDIVRNPELLTFSVEGRLKTRARLFKVLESKDLFKRKTSVATIYKMGSKQLLNKYVTPNLDELGGEANFVA